MKSRKIKMNVVYDGEKFKPGDIVTCINNEKIVFKIEDNKILFDRSKENDSSYWYDAAESRLELGKKYNVESLVKFSDRVKLTILVDNDHLDWFYPDRFVSLRKEREIKITKLSPNEK